MSIFNIFNLNFIINLALEIVFIGVSLILFQKFCKVKFSNKNKTIFVIANISCFILGTLLGNYLCAYSLTIICSIFIFYFLIKAPIIDILGFISTQLTLILNINFCISRALSITTYQELIALPICNAISTSIIVLIELAIYFYMRHFEPNALLESSIYKKSNLIIAASILDLIIVFSINYFLFETINQNFLYVLEIDLCFYILFTIVITSCYLEYTKQKINNLNLYNESILNMYDEARAFKHDFHNILQAIGGYIMINDMEGLKKYYKQITEDCKVSNNLIKLNPELVNNPAIYNILVDKYYRANLNNIQINLEVMLDLNKIPMHIYEFTRILGILLDNAIEASKECNEKNINIIFKQDNKKQMLVIENTYNNKQISIDKIFEKDFTTKPHNTGLGLWEVRRILNKNNNLNLFTSKNNQYFSQQLEIYSA